MKYFHKVGPASAGFAFVCGHHCTALVVGILFTLLSQIQAGAAVINAASPSFGNVSTAIALAANGDTIVIPAGTATWTSSLTINKAITLQGAGVGQTIVKDGLSGTTLLVSWTLPANLPSRLTGIDFQDGGVRVGGGVAIIEFRGSNVNGSTLRVDYSSFSLKGFVNFETIIGVVDHNTFIGNNAAPVRVNDTHWNDPTQLFGDKSWSAPPGYGSSQFLFFEDNTFNSTTVSATDAYDGARFVLRHNTFNNLAIPNNHGTESHGRGRGCRAMEIYNNTWSGNNTSNKYVGGTRSGSVLFHDNDISGYWGDSAIFSLMNLRVTYPYLVWGQADGTNVWDVNDPKVYFTGRAASASTSNYTVTVTGANWAINQWVDYTIHRTSNLGNVTTATSETVLSNTANTITYNAFGVTSQLTTPPLSFVAGDTLEFLKLVKILDGIGVGSGSLIQGSTPTPPAGWNDQVTEPCYSWNNVDELGHPVNFAPTNPGYFVFQGVHYFNNTQPPYSYTPYTYPHPLVSGAPAAPQNLHVMQ